MLRKYKFKIILIEKYKRVPNHSVPNMLLLLSRMVCNIVKYSLILTFGHRKGSLVHVVGFYGPMLYFEHLLVFVAYSLGYRVIYEMRGGGADLYYENGSEKYRSTFSNLINKTICVFSQGKENFRLIHNVAPKKRIFYYPNYVLDAFIPNVYPQKPNDRINFLYFGRVSKTKNVDLVIDIFEKVSQRYNDVFLYIVGNCPEPQYAESIRKKIADGGLSDRITMRPACNHEELKKILYDKHFYLFPTQEPHEGHSNALTEAMAWGVVPIATSQGFNKSVIGDKRLISSELSIDGFFSVIVNIIDNGLISDISKAVYERVKDNYTAHVVSMELEKEYEALFSM